ncbi:hypothetical protein QL285_021180 [Trifolium repens]|nr:hypothetical protein QL285_021180 [Trifolium repens]
MEPSNRLDRTVQRFFLVRDRFDRFFTCSPAGRFSSLTGPDTSPVHGLTGLTGPTGRSGFDNLGINSVRGKTDDNPPDIRLVILSSIGQSIGIKLLDPCSVALPQHVVEGHPSVTRGNLSHPWKWFESMKINVDLLYQPLILNCIMMLPGNTTEEARRGILCSGSSGF